ncbi:MAG: zinc dependent phospholipase C family protein, partial [Gemmatimonadota bacterium]
MPKWGIHNIVLSEATGELLATDDEPGVAAATDLYFEREAAMLGAVGPDLFFFAPDYEIVDRLFTLYQNLEEVIDLYNEVVQPIRDVRDAVVEPVEDAVETLAPSTVELIRQAVEEVRETADLFQSTLQTGLFAGVVSGVNVVTDAAGVPRASAQLFDEFRPPLQDNDPESEWFWFDMLHYRRTGQFGENLVQIAGTGTQRQRAYAYGYLSHIATDLVGHAFVNQIVGGPYRMHPQRHVVVENFMDTRKVFEVDGSSVNQTLLDKLGLPEEFEPLSEDLVDLLHGAFEATYSDFSPRPDLVNRDAGEESGFLTRQQIRDTYEIFYRVLEISKKMAVRRPEEPFSGVADVLADALDEVFEAPPSPPGFSGAGACSAGDILSFGLTSSSRDCYEEFFESVEEWAEYVGELLQWAVETLVDIVDLLLALLLSLPITVLMALLYGIQLLMYEIYQSVRFLLALEGFVTPEPVDVFTSHGRNLTSTVHCAVQPFHYPRFRDDLRSHLVCATDRIEEPATTADFFPSDADTTADGFVSDQPLDLKALFDYADSPSAAKTRRIEKSRARIGNAVDLTAWMIRTAADGDASERDRAVAHTDWNLDSDRGYGYKTWRGVVPGGPDDDGGAVEDEDFLQGGEGEDE